MKICIEIKNGKRVVFACSLLPEYYEKYQIREATFEEKEEYWRTKPIFDDFKHSVIIDD